MGLFSAIAISPRAVWSAATSMGRSPAPSSVLRCARTARALSGRRTWVTGLRAQQGVARAQLNARSRDDAFGVEKFNPLHDWTEPQVWEYIREGSVPYNALHDRHYPSIGCAPCTRAIAVGEDARAGRWWWENAENKECGLHVQRPAAIPIRVSA